MAVAVANVAVRPLQTAVRENGSSTISRRIGAARAWRERGRRFPARLKASAPRRSRLYLPPVIAL
jgi:hypothetical protein